MAGELVKAGVAALAYHAGLENDKRSMVQQRWVLEDRCKVCSVRLCVLNCMVHTGILYKQYCLYFNNFLSSYMVFYEG